jgi:hypothetical protein
MALCLRASVANLLLMHTFNIPDLSFEVPGYQCEFLVFFHSLHVDSRMLTYLMLVWLVISSMIIIMVVIIF